jgi:hypothetical protein
MKVHQHDSICIEKAGENMVGTSKDQKGRRRHQMYVPTAGSLAFGYELVLENEKCD